MSISSSLYADHSNLVKEEWLEKLKKAHESGDWDQIEAVIQEMEKFHFSE